MKNMTKNEKALLGRLKKKKRDELLFIIEQLLERKPDIMPLMELLIELPSSPLTQQEKRVGTAHKRMLNLAKIQHQVKQSYTRHLEGEVGSQLIGSRQNWGRCV